MATKRVPYKEPEDYFPKEIREKYFGADSKKTTTPKKAVKRTGTRSKKSK